MLKRVNDGLVESHGPGPGFHYLNTQPVFPKRRRHIQNILILELYTTSIQVVVKGTADISDMVVISLNQPAHKVEEKISGLER